MPRTTREVNKRHLDSAVGNLDSAEAHIQMVWASFPMDEKYIKWRTALENCGTLLSALKEDISNINEVM